MNSPDAADTSHTVRIRQIALVGHEYDQTEAQLREVFGLEVAYRDPGHRPGHEAGVSIFGLRNFVMPIGNQFLELVSPLADAPDTAGGRYIERRGGPGGYMILMQVPKAEYPTVKQRVSDLGIRLAAGDHISDGTSEAIHLHPKDLPGVIAEFRWCENEDDADGDWWPVERTWRDAKRTNIITAIAAAEIQTPDPQAVANRWAAVLNSAVHTDDQGRRFLALADSATIRFVPPTDGRPEGLGALDLATVDPDRAIEAARRVGCVVEGQTITLGGIRLHLVAPSS